MERDKEIINVNIDEIIPNRFQPRLNFEPEALKELSESIKQYGIFQPLVVRKLGNKYEIIAGERRYKAATMAGFKEVPCISVLLDDNESAEIALIENLQRRDLTPIEEARSYKKLLDRGYINQSQLAKRMGKSQSAMANKIRLLSLSEEVQNALLSEKISERHARSLLSIRDEQKQKELLEKIINNRMTVRDTDAEVKEMLNNMPKQPNFIPVKENIEELEPIKINENPLTLDELEITPSEKANVTIIPDELTEINENKEIKEIDIEKLTTSAKDINQEVKKPDIMDLLKIEDTSQNISFEKSDDLIEKVSIEDLPSIIEEEIPNVEEIKNTSNATTDESDELFDTSPKIKAEQEEISNEQKEIQSFIPIIGEEQEKIINYDNPQQQEENEEEITVNTPNNASNNTYITNNLKTSINTVRDCVKTLEKFGFSIDKEELDLTDSYQIIIKIAKTDI